MSHTGGGDSALRASPGHHGGTFGESSVQDLVPADGVAASGLKEPCHPVDQIALQLVHILKALGLHPAAAVRTLLPIALRGLVAAYVDIFIREHPDHLVKDRLEHPESPVLSGAEVARDAVFRAVRAEAGELRIGRQHLAGMARKLDLRDDVDVAGRGIFNNLPDISLRQVASRCERSAFQGIFLPSANPFLVSLPYPPCRLPGQLGIGVDLDPPPRVVGQVQVERAHLHRSHRIQLLKDEVLVTKIAGNVQHQASVAESRVVKNLAMTQGGIPVKHHPEARPGAVDTGFREGEDVDPLFPDGEPVGLVPREFRNIQSLDFLGEAPVSQMDPNVAPILFQGISLTEGHVFYRGRYDVPGAGNG